MGDIIARPPAPVHVTYWVTCGYAGCVFLRLLHGSARRSIRGISTSTVYHRLELPAALAGAIFLAAHKVAKPAAKAYRIETSRSRQKGDRTLRPGKATLLWNELCAQLQPHLRQYGQQVNLGRMLGLPRQRINAFVASGAGCPDAERTHQLLALLMATRQGKRPS